MLWRGRGHSAGKCSQLTRWGGSNILEKGGTQKLSSQLELTCIIITVLCMCKRVGHACAIYGATPVHLYNRV